MNSQAESTKIWALHNPLKSWTLYNLTLSDVRLLLLTLSVNELRSARVCKKNENEWHILDKDSYPDFFSKKTTDLYFDTGSYPESKDIAENTATSKTYFVIQPTKTLQPRLHKRFEVNVGCVIVGGNGKEHSTRTVDVSEGGFHFMDIIPNWVAGYFLVVVDKKYQLMCSLVEDQKEKRRVQIVSEEMDFNFIQYKNWLNTL